VFLQTFTFHYLARSVCASKTLQTDPLKLSSVPCMAKGERKGGDVRELMMGLCAGAGRASALGEPRALTPA